MRTIALLVVAVFLWNATVHEVLAQGQAADIRIIPTEEDNRGESPRTVQVQIQDVSRGPLADVQITSLPCRPQKMVGSRMGRTQSTPLRITRVWRPSPSNPKIATPE